MPKRITLCAAAAVSALSLGCEGGPGALRGFDYTADPSELDIDAPPNDFNRDDPGASQDRPVTSGDCGPVNGEPPPFSNEQLGAQDDFRCVGRFLCTASSGQTQAVELAIENGLCTLGGDDAFLHPSGRIVVGGVIGTWAGGYGGFVARAVVGSSAVCIQCVRTTAAPPRTPMQMPGQGGGGGQGNPGPGGGG